MLAGLPSSSGRPLRLPRLRRAPPADGLTKAGPTLPHARMLNVRELAGLSLVMALVLLWAMAAVLADPSANHYGMYDFRPPPSPYWWIWFNKLKIDSHYAIGAIDWRIWLVLPVYLGALLLIGSRLDWLLGIPAARPALFDKVFGALAGFVPCYIGACGLNRLLSLLAPARTAALASFAAVAAIALAIAVRAALARSRTQRSPGMGIRAFDWRATALVALLIVLAGVLSVQFGFAFVAGDRTIHELERVVLDPHLGPGAGARLPLFGYHYDELAFLLPVLYARAAPFPDPNALLVPFWATAALVKLSAFALTAALLRALGMRAAAAVVATGLVFYGALTFDPTHRYYLFDSANPVFFVLHPGRVISSLGLFWCLALATLALRVDGRQRLSWQTLALLPLLGLGLGSITINVALSVVAAVLLVFTLVTLQRTGAERLSLSVAIAFCALGLPAIYLRFEHYAAWGAPAYLAGMLAIVAAYAIAACLDRSPAPAATAGAGRRMAWRGAALLLVTIVLGLTTGNMTARLVADWMPWLRGMELLAPQAELMGMGQRLLQAGHLSSPHWPIAHQNGFGAFSAHFGLPLVLALLAWTAIGLRRGTRDPGDDAADTRALLIALCAFLAGLFAMDYLLVDTRFAKADWDYYRQFSVRTRLIEGGYYAVILLSLAALWKRAGLRVRQCMVLAMAILIAGPELSKESRVFKQARANASFILKVATGK
ncbi:hypothetical protein [Cupriavidus sp. AU9028]|uniref:hypothetical protein n=1 Tax=Cupriavidus sp. AU9028 TaxID=2871157 RepID=UPI001C94615A|nr:hypothetical protein [Cupriavidus sp. AU9028]MBY4898068.1 hypothetical protein [Cupriavidus sp. AU9028]